MSKLIVLVGVSCTGKSSWSEEYKAQNKNTYIVSRDVEREHLFGEYRMGSDKEENVITRIVKEKVLTLLSNKYTVILDNTHLDIKYIEPIIRDYNYLADISFKLFDTPTKEELIRRNQKRYLDTGKLIPEQVLHKQTKQYEDLITEHIDILKEYPRDEKSRHTATPADPTKEFCFIFDLDGTTALLDRNPFNPSEEEVLADKINPPVCIMIELIRRIPAYNIIFLSGRSDAYEEVTRKWIERHIMILKSDKYQLYMRKEGDQRKDRIIKRELFYKHIEPKYNVLGVFDDREQVVQLWQDLGIFTFDVSQGKGRF